MKPENKFRVWFLARLKLFVQGLSPQATFVSQKHADYASGGVLDQDVAINGYDFWVEFKLIPTLQKARKLAVSDLQKVELRRRLFAGVPGVLVVGLPLGPRNGYDVAVFVGEVPETVCRGDFRPASDAYRVLYNLAASYAEQAHNKFRAVKLVHLAAKEESDQCQAGC
jgi:hypothetical protein